MRRILKLGLALVMALGMWYYIHAVLIPFQRKQAALHRAPLSRNLGDLYPRWLGTRELLLRGRDPYGPEVTREIQIAAYGEVLNSTQHNLARDEQRFAYPAYVLFLLAPTISLPFPVVRDVFRLLLIVLTAASVPLWIHALKLRLTRTSAAIIALLMLGSYPVIQGLYLEQLTLLVCFLISASCAALASGSFVAAGILLALATIKPQLAVGVVAWLALWALGDWTHRKKLLWGLVLTMALLWLGAEWVLPGWIGRWWAAMHAYLGYNDPRSLLEILMGRFGGGVISVLVGLGVALSCWRVRRAPAGSFAFNACLLSVLAAGLLIKPKFPLYDVAILLPAILTLWSYGRALWERGLAARVLVSATACLIAWQWIWGLALAVLSLVALSTAQNGWKLPPAALFLLPLAVACLIGLLTMDVWIGRTVSQTTAGVPAQAPEVNFEKTSAFSPAAANGSFDR
jgi:hypothetical protein